MRQRPIPPEDQAERLLIRHPNAQRAIDASPSHYWGLVRAGKIQFVGKGKAGRAIWASIKNYVDELVTEAEKAKEAKAETGKAA
jgi:hypothetical protein